jgi:hypothetical protein
MTVNTLGQLQDLGQIERLVFDYAAAIDMRDYGALRGLLADELRVGFHPAYGVAFVGLGADPVTMTAEQFVERNRILFVGFGGTHHQVTNVRVDVSGDTAREEAYLQATHFLVDDHETEYTFGAFYDNELTRTPEGWKLAKIDITVTWERGDAGLTERARTIGQAKLGFVTTSA